MIVHGLKNCETTRKALKALSGRGAVLRDLRNDPVAPDVVERWLDRLGEALVNRASTTWRGLDQSERGLPPAELLARHPALIKRPVIEEGDRLTMGWGPAVQAAWSA